ncbi:MAG TPA: MlaD family protein [Solirubrobacteraceae bacterium]
MKKAFRNYSRDFIAIVLLAAIAAGVGAYILANQRLRFPWEATPYKLRAAFATAQAVTPGQGQTVRISGVRIGDISKVDLRNGQAIVTMDVDPQYKSMIHTDATALLRPKTGLKDMFVELNPGSNGAPAVKDGFMLPVQNTLPDINPDEFYSALDADSRDYLRLLVDGAGTGLRNRGNDLREIFRRFEPTHRDLAKVTTLVAQRHANLARLIHSLNLLNGELAGKNDQLAQLINSSSAVFRAFASEQGNISSAVSLLPGALSQTTQTLNKVTRFANILRPAATDLIPVAHALDKANHQILPFAREAAPIVGTQIRPFVRNARPLVRSLRPAAKNLATAAPSLTSTFTYLNRLFNLVAYNPNGREDPSNAARQEGYLFWVAWLVHDGGALFSTGDANGDLRPVAQVGTCQSIKTGATDILGSQVPEPAADFILNLTGVLTDPKVCGAATGG